MLKYLLQLNEIQKKIFKFAPNAYTDILFKEPLGDTLEELWVSYNLIEKLKGINVLRNLKVLYMSNNLVKEWSEFNKLQVSLDIEAMVLGSGNHV